MPSFTPPVVQQNIPGNDRLYGRFQIPVAQSVVKRAGHYVTTPYPWLGEIYELKEGIDYFLGGRTYTVTTPVANALNADGYTTT